MKLTIYDKYLIESMARLFPGATVETVVEQLIHMGVIDPKRCKILLVRENVAALTAQGCKRGEAMEITAEKFCCSVDSVRSYIYYHKHVKPPKQP